MSVEITFEELINQLPDEQLFEIGKNYLSRAEIEAILSNLPTETKADILNSFEQMEIQKNI
ncbi:MAG: hypothetical protein J0L87_12790 [Bacteroidetes bacterium]|nr:hypothetical protein [Bacteroidota bacterium]